MSRIVLHGATGKVGQEVLALVSEYAFHVSVKMSRNTDKASIVLDGEKLLLDFSRQEAFLPALRFAEENKLAFVSGTTGLNDKDFQELKEASKSIACFWASNTSLGVAVFKRLIQQLESLKNWDFHLHELHHNQKIDSPSGTAISLKEEVEKVIGKTVTVTDVRGGGIYGIHELMSISQEEILKIEHQALNRKVFARGALEAAEFLLQKAEPGLYGMDDLLDYRLKK